MDGRESRAPHRAGGDGGENSRGWMQRGWLEKKEGVTANWSRHWCQVEGSELHFYDDERSQGGSRLGVIDLKHCIIDHSTAVTADVGEIELKASKRTYRIQCGTDTKAEEWIEALSAAKEGRELKRPAGASLSRTVSEGRRSGGKAPKHPWTQEEDEKLVRLIIEHGPNHWAKIAQQIPGRVGKQCRERWQNHLNPDVNRAAEWSEEEEQALFKWHEILGNKWADIAKHLPGRTDNSVKNYFHKRVGQLKRGAPASRPQLNPQLKKSIEKSSVSKPSTPNRALAAKLVRAVAAACLERMWRLCIAVSHTLTMLCATQARQSSSGPRELELAGASGASPTPPRNSGGGSGSSPRRNHSDDLARLSAPERAQIALRARRNSIPAGSGSMETLSLTPDSGTTAEPASENIEIRSPPVRTTSGSNSARSRRRRLDNDSAIKEKKELNDSVAELTSKVDHVLQPSSSNIGSNNCAESGFYSPIPVSVCTTRVWGAPPPKVFRGPWMSGVNRTSLDALTMEVSLPTPPRDKQMANTNAGSLIPCANETEDHDDSEMMDVSVNSPGLALLGGAYGISPNPRALGLSSAVERMMGMMGCSSSADSPMMTVFYSPRLVHNDHQ